MARTICAGALFCALPFLTTPDLSLHQRGRTNVTTNVRGGEAVASCDDIQVRFDGAETYRAEERRTIARSAVRTLSVEGPRNGGIYVRGAGGDEYTITLCKAAAAWAEGGTLNDISLSATSERISVAGPPTPGWIAYLLISTPRGASIDLRASNGPIAVHDAQGAIAAHTSNGPIALRNSSGTIALDAQNGPIDITGAAGSVRARAENGPIGVTLTGTSWSGEGLDARANNGPLRLELPERYASGVEVDLSSHSPFRCRGSVCGQTTRDWDDRSRTLRFGGSRTVVRLSAANGPVSIDSRD